MVTNWHKMRGSERCDECGSRRWYAGDDQLRYCENGHRLEGFATTDVGEDDYTMTGRVTKKKKERRKREALKLEGPAAKKLYLQALQHVLRLQVDWVKKEGLKLDTTEGVTYEGLTKELWGLVCLLPGVMDDQAGEDSGTDAVASSSEPEASEAESTTTNGWLDRDGTNKLPNHTHTLALCYIAAVILKQPVTTADFHGWAQTGDVEYLAVLHRVPQNVKARLPAKYHRGLQIRDHIKPGKLLHTVQELAMALDIHFQVKLPTLNYTEILVRHILELTLPVEVYLMVKCLAEILDYGFEFPDGTSRRVRTMDNPEVLLVTLVVVAAKFIYSLDGVDRPPIDHEDPRVKQINWTEWETAMAKKGKRSPSTDGLERGKEYRTTQNEALMYNENKIDDFMDWYEKMWIDEDVEPKTPASIRRAFHDEIRQPRGDLNNDYFKDEEKADVRQRYRALNDTMRTIEPKQGLNATNGIRKRLERDYLPTWRTADDLPQPAKILYQEAADMAAIPLKTLITAASQVERRLEVWSANRERGRRKEEEEEEVMDLKGKGKENR